MSADAFTWREALHDAIRALDGIVERPEIEARWLVEEASGHAGGEYVGALDTPVTNRSLVYFDAMLARRVAGEPIQYVLGRWAFRTLDLAIDRRVLIPRPETEIVVGLALAMLDGHPGPRVADIGTGSGAIALSIAVECDRASVWASDVSPDALAVARANLAGIGRPATRVSLHEGSWFEALPRELVGTLDLIVSNPPYVAENETLTESVTKWEPEQALFSGPSGFEAIDVLLAEAKRWLVPAGTLVIEIGSTQGTEAAARAERSGYRDVRVEADLAGLDRVLIVRS